MIKPILLCECETWAVTEQLQSSFTTWEPKILRNVAQ